MKKRIKKNHDKVKIIELLEYIKEPESFAMVVEGILKLTLGGENLEKRHELQFGEFARAVATLAIFGTFELRKTVFSTMAGAGGNEFIAYSDLMDLFRTLHPKGSNTKFNPNTIIMSESISLDEFMEMNAVAPNALFPLIRFQNNLRAAILGTQYWGKKHKLILKANEYIKGLD